MNYLKLKNSIYLNLFVVVTTLRAYISERILLKYTNKFSPTLSFKQIVKNIFRILTQAERRKLSYLFLFNTFISIVDIASMVMLVIVIAFYTQSQHVYLSFIPQWLLQKESLYLFLIFLLFMVFKNWTALLATRFQYRFVYTVALRISKENLEIYLDGSYKDYVVTDSSVSIRKISYQPLEFSQHILAGFQQIIIEFILIAITCLVIIFYETKLFLILFSLLSPLIVLIYYLIKKKLTLVKSHIKSSNEKALQHLQEALTGFIDVNVYNCKKFFIDRFYQEQERLGKYLPDLQVSQNMSSRLLEMFAIIGLFLLFLINQYMGNPQTTIILNIGAFVAAAYKIIPGIIKILNLSEQIKTFGFTTIDLANIQKNKQKESAQENITIKSISFSDVTYSYHNKVIIDRYNATIQSGDFVGISGRSGIGKTTFVNLLLGFLEEEKGGIYINGKRMTIDERRKSFENIAYVKQQTFLIHDTIQNNICFDATIDKERFLNAVKTSGLDKFIAAIPEGIEKIITENGKNISGGQRQRIAIARALYKSADVYILDEPFNELDEASEISLLNHFKRLVRNGSIVILITHNTKSLSYCNKIVSMISKD